MTLSDVAFKSNVRTPEDDAILTGILKGAERFPEMVALIKANKVKKLYATSDKKAYYEMAKKDRENALSVGTFDEFDPNVVLGGYYRSDKDLLSLNLEAAKNPNLAYPSPSTAAVSHQVYQDTGDLMQFATALFLHEQAHNLFFKLVMPENDETSLNRFQKVIDTIGMPALKSGRLISAYSTEHAFEWYAESVLGYLYYPDRLKRIDAPTYYMVAELFSRKLSS